MARCHTQREEDGSSRAKLLQPVSDGVDIGPAQLCKAIENNLVSLAPWPSRCCRCRAAALSTGRRGSSAVAGSSKKARWPMKNMTEFMLLDLHIRRTTHTKSHPPGADGERHFPKHPQGLPCLLRTMAFSTVVEGEADVGPDGDFYYRQGIYRSWMIMVDRAAAAWWQTTACAKNCTSSSSYSQAQATPSRRSISFTEKSMAEILATGLPDTFGERMAKMECGILSFLNPW